MQYDLSILIPARNEMFLAKTIENILENIEGRTEVIVVLDGQWADPPIVDDPRVRIIYYPESVGQRSATNRACQLSSAKWVMKVDAHCAFDKGFDVKMMKAIEGHDDWTMVPIMKNLHAFDWVCKKCGKRWYQGPTPTFCHKDYDRTHDKNPDCDNTTEFERDLVWRGKRSPNSVSYCFDSTPHFQYFADYGKRDQFKKDYEETKITESMSLQGSCFMLTRDKYWELNICDENFGSWGSQGIEVACKTWLSGGRVVCNHNTWYAHMFRTQGGDFGFPYPLPGNQVSNAKQMAKSLFMNGTWDKQKLPLSWLLDKFWPVPGWTEEARNEIAKKHLGNALFESMRKDEFQEVEGVKFYDSKNIALPTKGIIYYTDNQLKLKIAHHVQWKLENISKKRGIPIVSSSLKPMNFGKNVYMPLMRGYLTMFRQILKALETLDTDIVYFCEHDVMYHESHFDFTPDKENVFYYNENVWKLRTNDGHAIHYDCKQLSGLSCYRKLALEHYTKRVKVVEELAKHVMDSIEAGEAPEIANSYFSRCIREIGFEPGTHRREARIDDYTSESFFSELPNVDIRHESNLTPSRWSKDQFRNQDSCKNWIESHDIPGWGDSVEFAKHFK